MFEKLIYRIEAEEAEPQQLELLAELEAALDESPRPAQLHLLKSLLYHRNYYIRREIAFLIDRYGISLNSEEQLRYHYALQQFEYLQELAAQQPAARELLFLACSDPSPRFRSRVTGFLSLSHCKTPREKALYIYAEGNYRHLVEMGSDPELRPAVLEVLKNGLQPQANPLYHRKQCAFALEQLQAMENASNFIAGLLAQSQNPVPVAMNKEQIENLTRDPFALFLRQLQQHGLLVDGSPCYPEIQIGQATRRVTYRHPGLQTWSKQERRLRIQPPPGRVMLIFDYCAIEPTLLLNFLLQRFFISLADIPAGDIYLAINPEDRSAAKTWLNGVINGGGRRFRQRLNPLQMLLLNAIDQLRQELLHQVWRHGRVETITGTRLPLAKEETNLGGKALNRLVQGSASELFNQAVFTLEIRLRKKQLPARVAFLLFDEVWVEASQAHADELAQLITEELLAVNQRYNLLLPIGVRQEAPLPARPAEGGDSDHSLHY